MTQLTHTWTPCPFAGCGLSAVTIPGLTLVPVCPVHGAPEVSRETALLDALVGEFCISPEKGGA